jgi:subtilisin family serine protease
VIDPRLTPRVDEMSIRHTRRAALVALLFAGLATGSRAEGEESAQSPSAQVPEAAGVPSENAAPHAPPHDPPGDVDEFAELGAEAGLDPSVQLVEPDDPVAGEPLDGSDDETPSPPAPQEEPGLEEFVEDAPDVVEAASDPEQLAPDLIPDEFVLTLLSPAEVEQIAADTGMELAGAIPAANRARLVAPEGSSPAENLRRFEELRNRDDIGSIDLNRVAAIPDENSCDGQVLHTIPEGVPETGFGQPCTIAFFDGEPAPERYLEQPSLPSASISDAQDYLYEASSIVAVIDTGIDPLHPAFAHAVIGVGYDFLEDRAGAYDLPNGVDDDGDGLTDEAYGHGTHVAGTILLVNPKALLLPYRVLDSDGNGNAFDVARAIHLAIDDGAELINLSLALSGPSPVVEEAVAAARSNGVLVLGAAGNSASEGVLFPARYDAVLAITAVDEEDALAPFSAWGDRVSLCAPGVSIYSSMPEERFAWWSGTSMATAYASGAASLVACVPGFSGLSVEEALLWGCDSVDEANPDQAGKLGFGRLDVEDAVLLHLGWTAPPEEYVPLPEPQPWQQPIDTFEVSGSYGEPTDEEDGADDAPESEESAAPEESEAPELPADDEAEQAPAAPQQEQEPSQTDSGSPQADSGSPQTEPADEPATDGKHGDEAAPVES